MPPRASWWPALELLVLNSRLSSARSSMLSTLTEPP